MFWELPIKAGTILNSTKQDFLIKKSNISITTTFDYS